MNGKADSAFKDKYETAKLFYALALHIEPAQDYPKERIKEIDRILKTFEVMRIYPQQKHKADSLMERENYLKAWPIYSDLVLVDPSLEFNVWLCNDIERLTDPSKKRDFYKIVTETHKADEKLNAMMSGDRFDGKLYSEITEGYKKAMKLNPKAIFPAKRLDYYESFRQPVELD